MDKTTEKLAAYAAGLSYADLTPKTVHAVKRSVLDSIGCAIGAFDAPPLKALRALASRVTARRPATIFGTKIKTSPEWAGFANGAMVRYLDFSDDYFGGSGRQAGPHPSDNIGSILAIAESMRLDGKAAVLGIALAYEAAGHLTDLTVLHSQGWDFPVMHAIGTAMGAGRVLGLSREQIGNAIAMALVPNIGLWQTRLGTISNWKGMAGPNGSRQGLFAALLAKEGITGPGEPFEGKAGFMKQLNNPIQLPALGGHGVPFKVEGTFFKYIPVMYSIQLPVWTAFEVRRQVDIAEIESIRVFLNDYALGTGAYDPDRWEPKTRESADHSGPYLIGAALVYGEIDEKTYEPERLRDPTILSLIKKVRVEEDKAYSKVFPGTFNCRFEVTLRSGRVVTVHKANPKGHPANPLSDTEIEEKFTRLVAPKLDARQRSRTIERVWGLDRLEAPGSLFEAMALEK